MKMLFRIAEYNRSRSPQILCPNLREFRQVIVKDHL